MAEFELQSMFEEGSSVFHLSECGGDDFVGVSEDDDFLFGSGECGVKPFIDV